MRTLMWFAVLLTGLTSVLFAAEPGVGLFPLGPEIQVNPEQPLDQQNAAISMGLDGQAIVFWTGHGGYGQKGRLLNNKGVPIGPEFSFNPYPDSGPSLEGTSVSHASGAGVLCWREVLTCYCRLTDVRGVFEGDLFRCSDSVSETGLWEAGIKVAMFDDASFVVAWLFLYNFPDGRDAFAIRGRFFTASGQPAGPTFELARDYPRATFAMSLGVAALDGHRAVVVWNAPGVDGSADGILARIVSRSGQPEGDVFLVNTYTANNQELPAVASNDKDRFVVAWESAGQDGFYNGVYGQLFDGRGTKIGAEFQISSDAVTEQNRPVASMDRLGNFVIAHYSFQENNELAEDTFLRAFRRDGTPRGPQIRANEQIIYQQYFSAIELTESGLLQVAYESWRQNATNDDDYGYDMMARRFVLACEADAHTLCLGAGGRFQVRAFWRTPTGQQGAGSQLPLTVDTGGFYFFSPGNFELLVKVLNACGVNGHYWIFAAGLTDVAVELMVTDTWTGEVQVFENPLGQAFAPIQVLDRLTGCGSQPPTIPSAAPAAAVALASSPATAQLAAPAASEAAVASSATAACSADPAVLCFRGGRFRVTATWQDFIGQSGHATAFPVSDESGLFYFFTDNNLELAVKVLDGCGINQRFWVFAVGLTNVQVELTVEDTQSGRVWRKRTNLGEPFPAVLDTGAFATCS